MPRHAYTHAASALSPFSDGSTFVFSRNLTALSYAPLRASALPYASLTRFASGNLATYGSISFNARFQSFASAKWR